MPQRQEVVNVVLAQLLQARGVVAAPEQILRSPATATRLPDVVVDLQGLRLAIEAEFSKTANAEQAAYSKAQARVDQGIAHMGVALLYPQSLRASGFARLPQVLAKARLRYCITTEVTSPAAQLSLFEQTAPQILWHEGAVDDLIGSLRRSREELTHEDTLERAIRILDQALSDTVTAIEWQPAATSRMAEQLGVHEGRATQDRAGHLPDMSLRERYAVNRVSALILVNALLFQDVLSKTDARVKSLEQFRAQSPLQSRLADHWNFILTEINYVPIFYMAHQLMTCVSADEALDRALLRLIDAASQIGACKASLRHDLAGRIYHRLLLEAKYLGAYYTSIPAATLLLKLALLPGNFDYDWADKSSLSDLRIADLACGTGTLLMAAADAAVDNHVRACVAARKTPAVDDLHALLVEKVLFGYDVVPSALHLSASTLSLKAPEKPINATNLYTMPLGGPNHALGTLDLLEKNTTPATLFSTAEELCFNGPVKRHATIPSLDLCVMNPPFTRSVGGNLLFGNLPEEERSFMQKRLQRIVQEHDVKASITAGLGSVFAALGHERLKSKGTLALVLPRALLSGVAWKPTRDLIAAHYTLEYVVASHDPGRWNFSENTSLSEVLVVARKDGKAPRDQRTVFVNLWKQPRTAIEALDIARQVVEEPVPPLERGEEVLDLVMGGSKYGEAYSVPWSAIKRTFWSWPCAFADVSLNRVTYSLLNDRRHCLSIDGSRTSLPLVALGDIASLGFDCRDIHDGFAIAQTRTQYAALWGHDSQKRTTIEQEPNAYLRPLGKAKERRPLRDAAHLWTKAGRLLFAERLRFNTMRTPAVRATERVLSNTWWPATMHDSRRAEELEKTLVLWLNSSVGLLILLAHRIETEGAWTKFKKPMLEQMPVLDARALAKGARRRLVRCYDAVKNAALKPIPMLDHDEVRAEIDKAFEDALGLPDLSPLRTALAHEPIFRSPGE